jgi:RHS repeat-associated protein
MVLNSEAAGSAHQFGLFGEPTGVAALNVSSDPASFGFQGGRFRRESGATEFKLRDLDSKAGRWLSQDPIGYNSEDANYYRFVSNNPVKYTDPTGEDIWIERGFPNVLHQSINVGDPNGNFVSVSFGLSLPDVPEGKAYFNQNLGGGRTEYLKTTSNEDLWAISELLKDVNAPYTATYLLDDTCRSYSQRKYQEFYDSIMNKRKKK